MEEIYSTYWTHAAEEAACEEEKKKKLAEIKKMPLIDAAKYTHPKYVYWIRSAAYSRLGVDYKTVRDYWSYSPGEEIYRLDERIEQLEREIAMLQQKKIPLTYLSAAKEQGEKKFHRPAASIQGDHAVIAVGHDNDTSIMDGKFIKIPLKLFEKLNNEGVEKIIKNPKLARTANPDKICDHCAEEERDYCGHPMHREDGWAVRNPPPAIMETCTVCGKPYCAACGCQEYYQCL